MTIQPLPEQGGTTEPRAMLFTPRLRLGWTYTDHRSLIAPYSEPPPDHGAISQQAAARLADARQKWQQALKWALRPSLMILVALVALGGAVHAVNHKAPFGIIVLVAVVLALPGTGWTVRRFAQFNLAKGADPQRLHQAAYEGWRQRAGQWEGDQLSRVAGVPEWGSASTPARRTDVFGGTISGWRCLLTVHGASILAERPLVVADLTGQDAAADLAGLTRYAGTPAAQYLLPRDLGRCGMLAGLGPKQLAEALTDAIHADASGASRADRAIDVRVLERLASAIGSGGITPARLAAAAEVALGRQPSSGLLSAEEEDLIGGSLFGENYLPQIGGNLVRLDAFLSGLASYTGPGTPRTPDPAYCTILTAEPGNRSAHAEILAALLISWLTTRVPAGSAVIIAGADEITGHQLEHLADACERAGVPLTLLFRHLRNDATTLIGGGATAFMRLGNHHEAEQAASFIGRQHTFVLSSLTATHGGDQTSTQGQTETSGHSESRGSGSSTGWTRDYMLGAGRSSGDRSRSRDYSKNYSWAAELSQSEGTNWSDATTSQRVYEYTVEPSVMQRLPETALLLLSDSGDVQPVECHPAIVALPQASTTPVHPVQPPTPLPETGQHQPQWPPEPEPAWPPPRPPDPRSWRRLRARATRCSSGVAPCSRYPDQQTICELRALAQG
jgi:hypothetical protein